MIYFLNIQIMETSDIKWNPDEGKRSPSKELFEGLWESISENLRLIHLQTQESKAQSPLSMGETIRENQKLSL